MRKVEEEDMSLKKSSCLYLASGERDFFEQAIDVYRASAVLVFGVPEGKLSQPRNLVGEFLAENYITDQI